MGFVRRLSNPGKRLAGRLVAAGIEEAMKTMTQAPPEVRRGHPRRHLVVSRFEPVSAEFGER